MNFPGIQFQSQVVESLMGMVKKQQQVTTDLMGKVQSYGKTVQGAWKGGDADEFAADIQRKFVPAIQALIAAIAGFSTGMSKATSTLNDADSKAKSMINGLADEFGKII